MKSRTLNYSKTVRNTRWNRVAFKRFYAMPPKQATPGENKAEIPVIFEANEMNLQQVMESKMPFLLEIYSEEDEVKFDYLHKAVLKENGAIVLGRLNFTKNRALVNKLQIFSSPVVLPFFDGKMFQFRLTAANRTTEMQESFLSTTLYYCYSKESSTMHQEALKELEQKNIPQASKLWADMIQKTYFRSDHLALAGLALCALEENNPQLAMELVNSLKQRFPNLLNDTFIQSVVSKVELSVDTVTGDVSDLLDRVKKNPDDLQAKYELGMHYNSKALYEKSVEQLIDIIKKQPNWNDRLAINTLLKIFEVLGHSHDLTIQARKKIGRYLF